MTNLPLMRPDPRRHTGPRGSETSCRNPLDRGALRPGAPSGARSSVRVLREDARRVRAQAPDLWASFIRATCACRETAAAEYAVCFQTSCNWWDGLTAPHAGAVITAFRRHPIEAARYLAAV